MAACYSSWLHPPRQPPSHWEALAGTRGARPAPSPWREPMGKARGGRVRASPPFCESITRSRWVGSCYSGASTPSPAGLLRVQWTGKYCLSALPDGRLALHPSPRRRPGIFGAAGRASLRLRPGSRAPPGFLLSLGLGRGRRGGCRGPPGGQRPLDWEGVGRARVLPVSGPRVPRPERTRRPRGPSRFPSVPRAHAPAYARPVRAFPLPVPPSRARYGPFRSPSSLRACARSSPRPLPPPPPRWALRVRGLSRRADSVLGLPRPPGARARPGDAALLPGRVRALLRLLRPPGPSPSTHKGWPRARPPHPPFVPARGGRSGPAVPRGQSPRRRGSRSGRGRGGAGSSQVLGRGADVPVSEGPWCWGSAGPGGRGGRSRGAGASSFPRGAGRGPRLPEPEGPAGGAASPLRIPSVERALLPPLG